MEQAPTAELFRNPLNPYTRGLLESIPGVDGNRHHRLQAIPGIDPERAQSAVRMPISSALPAARFAECCRSVEPPLENKGPNHYVACIRV